GQTLVARVERWSLRHGPAQQHAVELQAEVVVEARGRVLLDAIREGAGRARLARRLGRLREGALLPVGLEGHPDVSLREARPTSDHQGPAGAATGNRTGH